jgi:hypothetical protein
MTHFRIFIGALAWVWISWVSLTSALPHDAEHPENDAWFAGLMQPDNPTASCCGEADAYWCDELHVRDGKTFCGITDDRVIPKRTPVPVGTQILIPPEKLKFDRGNPTGHTIVFLSTGGFVYCFVQNGGV